MFGPSDQPVPGVEHTIKLKQSDHIAGAPYRLSPMRKEAIREKLDGMLSDRIVEACESPYAAPVVLVPKDETLRVCVD